MFTVHTRVPSKLLFTCVVCGVPACMRVRVRKCACINVVPCISDQPRFPFWPFALPFAPELGEQASSISSIVRSSASEALALASASSRAAGESAEWIPMEERPKRWNCDIEDLAAPSMFFRLGGPSFSHGFRRLKRVGA